MSETARKPNTVVFDVGNVLFHWDLATLFDKVIADPARREHFLTEVLTFDFHSRHDAGEEVEDLSRELLARHPEYAAEIDAYVTRFNETISGPVAGVHQLIKRLDESGVPLFALTNFGTTFWDGFHPTAPVFARFRDIVVSGEEKCAKPDPRIYAISERRFGRRPQDMLFIDDREDNIAAATSRGWHGHLFRDAGTLEQDLVRLGLLD